MKKSVAVFAVIAALCVGIFAGNAYQKREYETLRENNYETMISFSVSVLEWLKEGYDEDFVATLASHVYTAHCFSDDSNGALYQLWNALIFEGENIVGLEDELIEALQSGDSRLIEGMAFTIRAADDEG